MDTLLNIVQYVLGFDSTVLLPIIFFVVGLFVRLKPAQALKSALTIGVGFVGVFTIFGLLTSSIGPAATAMVARTGINLPIVDLGWPPLSAITWGGPVAPVVIPLTILINVVMIAFKWTKTVDVDMWNYWHFALAGTLVYYTTGNYWFGLLAAAIAAIVVLKLADWSAPAVAEYFGLEGISLPTLSSAVFYPVGLLGDKIINMIPGLNKIKINSENVQKKFGIFGEPIMVGTILGIFIGILAGYDFRAILSLGVNIGAVMFILPRMVRILMEGLLPMSDAVRDFLSKRYPDRDDLYIGLDIAVATGDTAVISSGLILVPLAILFAFITPGNEMLPVGDLANMAVMISMIVLATKGNVFRSILIGIPVIIADLLIGTALAPTITEMAQGVNFEIPEGSSGLVSSFLDGGNPFRYWLVQIFNGNLIALILIPIIAIIIYMLYRGSIGKKRSKLV